MSDNRIYFATQDFATDESTSVVNLNTTIGKMTENSSLDSGDFLILRGTSGMRKILASNAAKFFAEMGNAANRYLQLVNLGTSYTSELKADISSGTFQKAIVGGYLTINSHLYYLAHPNYWKNTGDTACNINHMLVVPGENLTSGVMNDSHVTTGGYYGSKMRNSGGALETARSIIQTDFGAANILTHRELLTNAVSGDKASGWAWYDSDIELMTEAMVYGTHAWGSAPNFETGIDKTQIKLFAERPDLITNRSWYWLRDVVSSPYFAYVSTDGNALSSYAGGSGGVRPVFAIC